MALGLGVPSALALAPVPSRIRDSLPAQELSFDDLAGYKPPRLRILWLENTLDCRTWTYYCDLRAAMAKLHDLCTPRRGVTCMERRRPFNPPWEHAGSVSGKLAVVSGRAHSGHARAAGGVPHGWSARRRTGHF